MKKIKDDSEQRQKFEDSWLNFMFDSLVELSDSGDEPDGESLFGD